MTVRDLEYFSVMAAERSISRAAERLLVAQPALSQCLQKMEREMNAPLFVRSSRGVRLTSQGECFLAFAQSVLRERRELEKRVRDVENAEAGATITLGFTGAQATYVLPHILPEFQERHPGIHITLVEATSDEMEQMLLRGQVDPGILHLPVLHRELDCFEISRDRMVVVPRSCSDYRDYVYEKDGQPYLDTAFLREEPLILTLPGQRSRMVCDQLLANAGIVPRIKQASRNLSTLDALAQVDYATAIMPKKQVSPSCGGEAATPWTRPLRPPTPLWPPRCGTPTSPSPSGGSWMSCGESTLRSERALRRELRCKARFPVNRHKHFIWDAPIFVFFTSFYFCYTGLDRRERGGMVLKKPAIAGTLESSDCQVTVRPGQGGVHITLESDEERLFGDAILATVRSVLEELGVDGAEVEVLDKGALDCVIRARTLCAVSRGRRRPMTG